MKKAVASLILTVCLSLAACQSPLQDETGSEPSDTPPISTTTLTESQIVAQIEAAFLSSHPGEPSPDIELFEKNDKVSYYQANPSGLGGYILYSGAMNLYTYTQGENAIKKVDDFLGNFVTDISSDNTMSVGFVLFEGSNGEQIGARVSNLKTGETKDYLVDNFTVGHQAGAGVFSPDSSQMAFAVTETDSENENTVVYLVDLGTESMSEFSKTTGAVKLTWQGEVLTVAAAY